MEFLHRVDTERTTTLEGLLMDIVKSLYARDPQVLDLLELPVAQLRVLNVLAGSGPERRPTMSELAEALGVALSTATQIAERIEKRGLVRREHADPDDRRVVRLALTAEGRHLMQERRRGRQERLGRALSHLSESEQATVVNALVPLAEALRLALPLSSSGPRAQADAVLA